jgi:type IV pilus assembly protein PilB
MIEESKEKRLGQILRDVGLLTSTQLDKALREQEKTGSRLVEILKKEISLQQILDVLTYEIPLPFGAKDDKDLKKILLETGLATEEDLQKLIDETELGQLLVEEKYITEEDLEKARAEQRATDLPLWRILINLRLVTLNTINSVLKYQMYQARRPSLERLVGEILVNTNQITKTQLNRAKKEAKKAGKSLGQILIEEGTLSAEKIAKALGKYLNIPFLDLNNYPIEKDAVFLVPENFIRENKVLPVKIEGNRLHVALIDPLNVFVKDNLGMITGKKVVPSLTTEKELDDAIIRLFEGKEAEEERETKNVSIEQQINAVLTTNVGGLVEDVSTVQLVASIIEGAINANATDIHLEPQQQEQLRVRYRIDGLLHDIMTLPKHLHAPVISRIKVLADMDITERRQPQDGHITMKIKDTDYYLRIATVPTKLGERLVVRLLTEGRVITGLKQLGFEPEDLEKVEKFIVTPYGMILVTGPVGSGKTTTLYSALNTINILTKNIMTIEDPVEYQMPGISQIEVDSKSGLTFASGLRSILRQDPNTLMVGEIRDPETAQVAVRAALTGQQIFSTLHTQDAAGAISTLSYMGVQPFWIASALIGVIAQRLVRKICPYCKGEYKPDTTMLDNLKLLEELKIKKKSGDLTFYRGAGCDRCFHTGYSGRTGVFEVLRVTDTIKELIASHTSEAAIKTKAIEEGMSTLLNSGIKKVLAGITTVEEVIRVIL